MIDDAKMVTMQWQFRKRLGAPRCESVLWVSRRAWIATSSFQSDSFGMATLLLLVLLVVHSEWYVVNTTGVLLGAGVCVMLGVTFVPALAILFMLLAAVYDFWAVYKSKHMLDLADTMVGLRLPILLVAPQGSDYSLIEETERAKRPGAWRVRFPR